MDALREVRPGRTPRRRAPAPAPDRPHPAARAPAAAVLIGMQRRVGNHAVARTVAAARARSPVLQRMNLEQTRWIDGLTTLEGKRRLVSDGRFVNLYAQVVGRSDDRFAAQKAAAEANARLGAQVDDKALETWRLGSNEKWTRPGAPLDDARQRTLDPFFYAVRVPFAHEGSDEQIEMYFQHAAMWTAYVQAIFDTSNPATKPLPTMYDLKAPGAWGANVPSTSFPPKHEWHAYSNVHDVERRPRETLFESTTGGGARHFDAYTKLVGEGARWRCVRAHGRRLRDDSLFFVIGRGRDRAYGVTFETLWKSWKKVFDKDFDISDRRVANAIRDGAFDREGYKVEDVDTRRLTVYDYDLDRGKSYEPEVEESPLKRKREEDEGSDKKRRRPDPIEGKREGSPSVV
jgi:hypothetical protein